MSDVVTCKAVLTPRENHGRFTDDDPDHLFMQIPEKNSGYREIPCYKKGRPRPDTHECRHACWEYEERDGRLHITPSLFCTDSGFHTDYNWNVAYAVCPQGVNSMTHFFVVNPDRVP